MRTPSGRLKRNFFASPFPFADGLPTGAFAMGEPTRKGKTAGETQPTLSARLLAGAAEEAIADLEQRLALGMGPLERALAARIREAVAQLLDCSEVLERDELMIRGSTGQQRPHPMLKTLAELRREIADGLKELVFRAEHRAMYERSRQLTIEPDPQPDQPRARGGMQR